MPRNGSGSFGLVAGNPVVPSTVISSTWANNTLNDIASGLTQSIANDGQTTPVANLPMATFRHTNVGNAAARNDYAAAGQVQDSSLHWLTSVAGTNTITAVISPSPTAYVAGQAFRFVAAGTNTGPVTININGLGAKNITKNGTTALASGDIRSGAAINIVYDGTQFQASSVASGALVGIQVISATGTYTPTAGTNSVVVHLFGGGGGGAGSLNTGATDQSVGGGGGAGGYACSRLTTGFSGVTVTIGAAGTGGGGGLAGNPGGTTSFGAVFSATGGSGGFAPNAAASSVVSPGAGGGSGSGGNIVNSGGAPGTFGVAVGSTNSSGIGGSSPLGAGGSNASVGIGSGANGNVGVGFASGGGGAVSGNNQAVGFLGGAGTQGICIIYEYA